MPQLKHVLQMTTLYGCLGFMSLLLVALFLGLLAFAGLSVELAILVLQADSFPLDLVLAVLGLAMAGVSLAACAGLIRAVLHSRGSPRRPASRGLQAE